MQALVERVASGGHPSIMEELGEPNSAAAAGGADDDVALVNALRSGRDERAAQALFDRHALLVRRILARTLGPFHDVEDHVQDTFAAFFRQLRELRDPDAARAFLVSIAVRLARRELRSRRLRRILRFAPNEELPETAVGGVEEVEARMAIRQLFAVLDELDAASRIVFTLRHIEEMELMEVAVATGESLASVKRRLARVVPIVNARLTRDPAVAPYLGGAVS